MGATVSIRLDDKRQPLTEGLGLGDHLGKLPRTGGPRALEAGRCILGQVTRADEIGAAGE